MSTQVLCREGLAVVGAYDHAHALDLMSAHQSPGFWGWMDCAAARFGPGFPCRHGRGDRDKMHVYTLRYWRSRKDLIPRLVCRLWKRYGHEAGKCRLWR